MACGLLQGGRVMTTRLRLHPALLCAVVGAGLCLGAGSALPIWTAALREPPLPDASFPAAEWAYVTHRHQSLWEVLTEQDDLVYLFLRGIANGALALVLLAFGGCAGLLCWLAWQRRRSARRRARSAADEDERPAPLTTWPAPPAR